jgi:peptidoglycan/xylan/chitin deacetylase (PgdA/CDA1 family)
VEPIAAWTKPAYKLTDIRTDLPPNAVALTIDDGPHPEWTPRVLDLLDKYQVKATFCLIGEQIEDNAKVVRMMTEAGHEVANHTWSHPIDIAGFDQERVDREITKAHRRIAEVTLKNPKFFRSPGGNWSKEVFRGAAQMGMIPIEWDNDPRDWSRPGTDHIVHQMLQAAAGDILLCHDGGGDRSETLRALRTVIPALQGRGLQFVTLTEPSRTTSRNNYSGGRAGRTA